MKKKPKPKKTPGVLIAYITWDRIVPWKILSIPDDIRRRFFPIGYGSNQKVLPKHCKKGTRLYVVTLPWAKRKRGKKIRSYPLSLVACLEVRDVYCRNQKLPAELRTDGMRDLLGSWCWVAAAEPKSKLNRFCELNNVEDVFKDLGLIKASDLRPKSNRRKKVGSRLQSVRALSGNNAGRAIEAFDKHIETAGKRVFISFRSGKSKKCYPLALHLAEQFLELGNDRKDSNQRNYQPWIDSHAIPLYAPKDDKSKMRLRKLIQLGIGKSDLAVELVSPDYALPKNKDKQGWTRLEHTLINRRKRSGRSTFRSAAIPLGVPEDDERVKACNTPSIPLKPLKDLARRISAWHEAQTLE